MSDADSSALRRLERIAASQALLAEVSRSLGPASELDATVKPVLGAMRELVEFRGGSICLVEGQSVRMAACDPPASDEVLALRLPIGSGIAGRVIETGQTIYVPDLDADRRVDADVRRTGSNAGMVSYLCVPLVCLGQTVGLLQVDSTEPDAFDEVDIMLLEGLAAQTASAIESARLIEEMTRVDELKRDFISLVSHELRTPLTIAAGMIETHKMVHPSTDPDAQLLLRRATVALSRLGRLIEELITMSQLTAGELRRRTAPVALRPLIEQVVRECPEPESVEFVCASDAVVETDGEMLLRVLGALLDNAVLYGKEVSLVADEHAVVVRDRGPGLPAELAGREHEPFARSGDDTTIAGLGLGLTLARALTTELGGSLEVTSSPGVGTQMRVVFGEP
jgi:signal transduction histidine kinase